MQSWCLGTPLQPGVQITKFSLRSTLDASPSFESIICLHTVRDAISGMSNGSSPGL